MKIGPDGIEQLVLGHQLSGSLGKAAQHFEGLRRQCNAIGTAPKQGIGRIQPKFIESKFTRFLTHVAPSLSALKRNLRENETQRKNVLKTSNLRDNTLCLSRYGYSRGTNTGSGSCRQLENKMKKPMRILLLTA